MKLSEQATVRRIFYILWSCSFFVPIILAMLNCESNFSTASSFMRLVPGINSFAAASLFPVTTSMSLGIILILAVLMFVLALGYKMDAATERKIAEQVPSKQRLIYGIGAALILILPWLATEPVKEYQSSYQIYNLIYTNRLALCFYCFVIFTTTAGASLYLRILFTLKG